MRTQARLKLGYYPLAGPEARRIGRYLQFSSQSASVLDPCAGTGAALCDITASAQVKRYGVELDAYRAEEARKILDEVIQGSAFDAHAPVESFSMIYLNPAEIWRSLQVQHGEACQPTNGAALPTPEPNLAGEVNAEERPHWIESASPAVQLSLF